MSVFAAEKKKMTPLFLNKHVFFESSFLQNTLGVIFFLEFQQEVFTISICSVLLFHKIHVIAEYCKNQTKKQKNVKFPLF